MKLLRRNQPDVERLVGLHDLDGLAAAARFQDLIESVEGYTVDRGEQVRQDAILGLGQLGPEAGNGTVAAALRDPSDRVRSAAVRVLYAREEVDPLADALRWLPSSAGTSRHLAFQAILELRRSGTARRVARALVRSPGDDPLADADVAFLHTLIQPNRHLRPVKGVVRELVIALADDREEVGDRAEELLVRLAPASTKTLIRELERGRAPERAAAVLGSIGDTRAMQPLIEALEHRDPRVRLQAAAALGELRDPDAVESLLRSTRDPDSDVRAEASHALDRMGASAVIVGMSALMRPMIADAVAAATHRPALNGERPAPPQLGGPTAASRFADALEQARAAHEPPR